MQLAELYQEIILDHYRTPRGEGTLPEPLAAAHHVNPTCGDEITVEVASSPDGTLVLRHQGIGCSISRASASVMSELTEGATPQRAEELRQSFTDLMHSATAAGSAATIDEDLLGDAVAFSGVAKYPARIKCALLPWMAMQDACIQAGLTDPHGPASTDAAERMKS